MSNERFKQEAALVVLDRLMEATSESLLDRFSKLGSEALTHRMSIFEEHLPPILGALAEAIADGFVGKMGPDLTPFGDSQDGVG